MTDEEIWRKAYLYAYSLNQLDLAQPLFEQILSRNQEHKFALFCLGHIYLERKDERTVNYMEKGLQIDPYHEGWAAEKLMAFYEERGDFEKSGQWYQRYLSAERTRQLADMERQSVGPDDGFILHDLDQVTIERARWILAEFQDIRKAFIVRKKVTQYSHQSVYLVIVALKWKFHRQEGEVAGFQQFLTRKEWHFPEGSASFFAANSQDYMSKVKKFANALVFERKS